MADITIAGHKFSPVELGGIGVGALVLTYYLVKQHKASAAAASSATSATAIDPVTGLPYSEDNEVDPLTGMTYLAEAQEYGSVQAAEDATADESAIDYGSVDGTDYGAIGQTSDTSTGVVAQTYASNAAWAQAVEAGLTDVGYTSTDVAAALGLYLAAMPLGTAPDGTSYVTIVEAAIAEYGPPPVGTYQIIQKPATGTGTGTGTGTSTTQVTVPNVVGMRTVEEAVPTLKSAGLVPNLNSGFSSSHIDYVVSQTPGAGKQVAKGSTVDLESSATKP